MPPDLKSRFAQLLPQERRGIAIWLDYADYVLEQREWIVSRLVAANADSALVVQSARHGDHGSDVDHELADLPPDGMV